ncbi:SdpI family protein [Arthrobacter rhombi]|uniref:Putative integral membrane protein n=1 Tax=Arthrobacter rhombi TaxID=71253 RepID=A0A1R4GWM7_9MICC|nr:MULTISPECIES: SdpI family protein [Micrococcaceae]PCC26895.1 hypothetical protein CIK75_00145 [Glutamicibacter sp. BW78]SJM72514.1 Putative integral membrane protein [Arthrobacter rhombi]
MEDAIMTGLIMSVVGLVMAVFGWLGFARRLPANAMIGIRLPATRVSDEAWEETHVAAGPWLILSGLIPFFAGVFILLMGAALPEWTVLAAYAGMLIFVLVGTALGVRAANAVNSSI